MAYETSSGGLNQKLDSVDGCENVLRVLYHGGDMIPTGQKTLAMIRKGNVRASYWMMIRKEDSYHNNNRKKRERPKQKKKHYKVNK